MQSLPLLGVLIAGVGGFLVIAGWDTRAERRHRKIADLLAYSLIAAGIGAFVAGVIL
jgi:hypothetical protein